jgi:ferredoxin-NADP reductase
LQENRDIESRRSLRVTDIRAEARGVVLVELRAPDGGALPPFAPGAHLEIELPNGLIRHYSLANDSREKDRYLIGVGRDLKSRGGSDYVHRELRCGATLQVGGPRNNFPLDPDARSYLFVAGGIGITPIMAMVRWCVANGRDWRLHYAARSRARAAFYEELRDFARERVVFHFDDEAGTVLDVAATLSRVPEGARIYCCGPASLMTAMAEAAAPLPAGTVRFEYFTAAEAAAPAAEGEKAFTIVLRRSGVTLAVPPDRSILEVLEEHGRAHPFSCREGLCRTCETAVCEGEPDHRDFVLSEEEQRAGKTMTICVSRARSDRLVLDL